MTNIYNNLTLIFDNAGGLTIQVFGEDDVYYQHYYNDMAQAAIDVMDALDMMRAGQLDYAINWGGNEVDDGLLTPTDDEIANGGYRVICADDYHSLITEIDNTSWHNMQDLANALNALNTAGGTK